MIDGRGGTRMSRSKIMAVGAIVPLSSSGAAGAACAAGEAEAGASGPPAGTPPSTAGKLDPQSDWDAYLAELDKIGIDRYLELVRSTYDRDYQ